MRIKEFFNFRTRYFNRVYLWVTSAIIMLVTIFSIIVYINTENIVLKNDYQTSKKILHQINYNIKFMDDMIKNVCKYLYFNNDVQAIMYDNERELQLDEIIRKMDRLRFSVLSTNPYLHSIYIYNNNNETYYSTYSNLFFEDKALKSTMESYEYIPKLTPICRKIEASDGKGSNSDVFTYFMYEDIEGNRLVDGTVIVNVQFKWLLENINTINMTDSNREDQVFLVDKKGTFFSNGSGIENEFEKLLKTFYSDNKQEYFSEKSGFFKSGISGKEFIVSYLYVENTELMLLKAQPSEKVYEYVNRLKYSVIIITAIFLLITLFISVSVTRGIYKPVKILVNQVKSVNQGKEDSKDEFTFLKNVYKNNSSRLSKYEKERNSYKEILKEYWLKRLLTDSTSVNENDFVKENAEYKLAISQNSGYAVCVIKIDNLKENEQKYTQDDIDLLKFAIINISTEIISANYVNEGVDLKDKHVTLVISVDLADQNFYIKIEELLKQAQENIHKYFDISISVSVSEITKSLTEITEKYNSALSNSAYRFVYGRQIILVPEKLHQNMLNRRLDFSFSLEKKLVEAIKAGNIQNIEESLKKVLSNVKELNYNNIIISLLHLIDTVRNTTEEINKSRIEPVYVNFEPISQNLLAFETMDEFEEKLLELLKEFFKKGSSIATTNSKHAVLVDTIQEVISRNYHDNDLCVSSIAEMTKISAQHLGRIFKEKTKMSIPEYINDVRMEKAAKLLEQSDLTVNEISLRVGIANETYFYSVFKKKFGSTPKEYTLKKALNNVDTKKTE